MTDTMQQLVFIEPRQLEWREVKAPALEGDGQALVRPIASSTCDIDQWIVQGESPFEGPFPIGHECVAEVLNVGDAVGGTRPGQLVVVPWHISCGICDRCRAGRPAYCRTTPRAACFGLPSADAWGATFDEVVRVPYADAMLTVLPPGVDPAAAVAAGDNLTIGLELMGGHLRRRPGAEVLVLGRRGAGGGSVSLFAADTIRALGASRVVYVDSDPERRMIAEQLGAQPDAGPPRRELGRFDLLFDASTDAEAFTAAIPLLYPGAAVEIAGGYFGPITLDAFQMYEQDVTLHTCLANAREHVGAAFDLILQRRINPAAVLGDPLPMQDAAAALAEPATKPLFIRDRVLNAR